MIAPDPNAIGALLPKPTPFILDPLPGDAGNRRYFRVRQNGTSFILMQLAEPEGFKKSEEAVTGEVAIDELPFLNIQRHLERHAWPVPKVHRTDMQAGLLLLEDFGDITLMNAIRHQSDAHVEALYRAAVDHLAAFQSVTPNNGCVAHHRQYDAGLLMWEFDHYIEYGIEALRGLTLAQDRKQALRAHFGRIANEIAAQPAVLVHRDYHSRNIMVKPDGTLGILDFQDALMGPVTYDLASLLWDPYVTLPQGLSDRLIARYREVATVPLPNDLPRMLQLTALQRLMKAAGRFVYIDRVKKNPKFLADVPVCLARVRAILRQVPELAPLRELLEQVEPRLAG